MKRVTFLGGGRITSALIAGLRLEQSDKEIVVHDRHRAKLKQLKRQYGVLVEEDLRQALQRNGLLIVAVRPDAVAGLLKEIAPHVDLKTTAVSLAAGIPLSKLDKALSVRWARAMPSPLCRTGQGMTALTFSRKVPPGARAEVRNFFGLVGQVLAIPEKQFDAFTVTFSSSHGYHALKALIRAAESVGLNRKIAPAAAAHALADGIVAWREGTVSLDELLEEAATPGGTAAAVMASLDDAGHQRMLLRGLRDGIARARKNAAG